MKIELDDVVTISDIARSNGLTRQSVSHWIRRGLLTGDKWVKLPAVTIGYDKVVSISAFKAFIAATGRKDLHMPDHSA